MSKGRRSRRVHGMSSFRVLPESRRRCCFRGPNTAVSVADFEELCKVETCIGEDGECS